MTKGVVAAGHPITANAACEVLAVGGNAFDAVLAAMLASCVAEPVLASLGGGGFLLAHPDGGRPEVLDFFVQTPRAKRPQEDIEFQPILADFGTAQQEFHIGMGTIATPGVAAGIAAIHRALCSLPLEVIAAPAIAAARDGVEVNPFQHYIATIVAPILSARHEAFALHAAPSAPDRFAAIGDRLANPALADALDALVREGPRLFYSGEIAARIADDCRTRGGWLTRDDLSGYQVARRQPLVRDYRGHRIFLNPPPSVGGTLIAVTFGLLEALPVFTASSGGEHLLAVAEAMALTQQVRRDYRLDFNPDSLQRASVLDDDTLGAYAAALQGAVSTRGTTQISVADRRGNLASLTLSNGEGSGYVIPGTGIMLNNMLGEEDLNAGGFHRWREDVRVASMMAPTLACAADGAWHALGSGGSNRIRSAVLQTLINLLDGRMEVDVAVRMPRIHVENNALNMEAGLASAAVVRLIERFSDYRLWPDLNLFFGGAHAVTRHLDGALRGAGDPRRGGVCLTA